MTNAAPTEYRWLQHWRGVAALAVMMFHGFGAAGDVPLHPSAAWLASIARWGWLGVHIFFVISGYCIAAAALLHLRRDLPAGWFIVDRALRIYPPYWAACALVVMLYGLSSLATGSPAWGALPRDVGAFVAALALVDGARGLPSGFLLVAWSLGLELAFYGVVTLAILLRGAGVPLRTLMQAGGAAAMASMLLPSVQIPAVLAFWPEFYLGALVFTATQTHAARSARAAVIGAPLVVLLAAAAGLHDTQRTLQLTVSTAFALLILLAYRWDALLTRPRAMAWLGGVGAISYSLYLTHVPVGSRVVHLAMRALDARGPAMLALQVAYWIACIAFAWAFWRLCESPSQRLRLRLRSHRSRLSCA